MTPKSRIKYRLIVFAGPVGAGKSTQIRYLRLALKGMRVKNKSVFLKSGHMLAYALTFFIARAVSRRRGVAPIRALLEDAPQLFKRIFKLWLLLDLLSITVKFLLNIYIPFRLGYAVLVEEYIPATIADYLYLSRVASYPLDVDSFPARYLLKLANLCRPVYMIYLGAEDTELYRRWIARESTEERSDYLSMQRTILLKLCKKLADKFIYENTESRSPKEVSRSVIGALLRFA